MSLLRLFEYKHSFGDRHPVARKTSQYDESIEAPDYRNFAYCRRCRRNRQKHLRLCPDCKLRMSHGARDKKRWPNVYNVHRY